MKRLALLLAVLVAATLLSGCGGDDAALTVNGDTVLTDDEVRDELDQIQDDEEFLTANDARGQNGSLRAGFVGFALTNHVLSALLAEEIEDSGFEVTAEDEQAGEALTALLLGTPGEGRAAVELEDLPAAYRDAQVELYTNFITLIANNTDDPDAARAALAEGQSVDGIPEVQERLAELRADADVEVDSRYGRWTTETDSRGEIVPLDGPADADGG